MIAVEQRVQLLASGYTELHIIYYGLKYWTGYSLLHAKELRVGKITPTRHYMASIKWSGSDAARIGILYMAYTTVWIYESTLNVGIQCYDFSISYIFFK